MNAPLLMLISMAALPPSATVTLPLSDALPLISAAKEEQAPRLLLRPPW